MQDRSARLLAVAALAVATLGWTDVGESVRQVILPARSVGTAQLRDNAVVGAKIRTGSVTSSDIADGTIRARDLATGAVPTPLSFSVRRSVKELSGVGQVELLIPCEPGQTPIAGGGGFLSSATTSYTGNEFYGSLINSGPATGEAATDDRGVPTGWVVTARSAGGKKRFAGYVICASTQARGTSPAPPSRSAAPTPPTPKKFSGQPTAE